MARYIVASIIEERAEKIIPSNYRERSKVQEILDAEQEMIDKKSAFEQKIFNKHRNAFSNNMSGDKFLTGKEMSIKLWQLKDCSNLYCNQPQPVPANICWDTY